MFFKKWHWKFMAVNLSFGNQDWNIQALHGVIAA